MKIIYTTETGIAVVHPTGEISIEQVFEKDVPDQYKSTAYIVEDDVIPSDRTFRDAWQHDCNDGIHSISENLDKAKEIHKERLRAERDIAFKSLDVDYMKALEESADTKSIVAEKQRLRDITKLVDKVQNTDQLRKVLITSTEKDIDSILIPVVKDEKDADI